MSLAEIKASYKIKELCILEDMSISYALYKPYSYTQVTVGPLDLMRAVVKSRHKVAPPTASHMYCLIKSQASSVCA